ncbi:TetR/AcrR family transcriptional regulator [Paenibacillus athensensis]|uniref:TetR family transcriptional regulator n=1 Tax=Paenibacillus athensensis TaxID=1967502 RepID=A0A4Y8PV82_9BACL|nr:TetR/AcrR family transcriptional regulator [Paenibacillus athensensis]MCD1261847.1 TetR/AcrR family transcriptional regulator [Paenibacillus athensensis]
MHQSKQGSAEKLLRAAIDLISEKGYNGVTTEEIATAAQLSEKTLFRHFGSKQNLLEAALERFQYAEEMQVLFNEKLVWDLETDLLAISRKYHETMNRDRKLIQIALKDERYIPGFKERRLRHPRQLLTFLTAYLNEMKERGSAVCLNPPMLAFTFMMAQYGAFMNDLEAGHHYPGIQLEAFIQENVKIFVRSLTPPTKTNDKEL